MAVAKVHRPVLFHFKTGQHCLLRVPSIDRHWHPFSIASGPDSDFLELFIAVYGPKSWSNQLWQLLGSSEDNSENRLSCSDKSIPVEVKGPYGTSLGGTEDFSHAIAIGGGTGIVPVLSMLKQHVHQRLRLDPHKCFAEQEMLEKKFSTSARHIDMQNSLFVTCHVHVAERMRTTVWIPPNTRLNNQN